MGQSLLTSLGSIGRGLWANLACAALLGCGYPAPPPSWSQIDRDRPAREPDVPFQPSSAAAIAAMIELGQPGPSDVVYDLGCGDGRVVIEAVERSGARGVGVDLDPKLIRRATQNAARAGVSERVTFRTEDLFATDIREATVVMLFLWPEINLRLLPKLLAELPPGARIVSNWHDMGDLKPTRVITLTDGPRSHRVYLWVVGPATGAPQMSGQRSSSGPSSARDAQRHVDDRRTPDGGSLLGEVDGRWRREQE